MKKILSPSILSADFSCLKDEILKVQNGGAEYLHIDVMDGQFVPNITLGPPLIKSIRKTTNMVFDVHLMINNPDNLIDAFYNAGADIITIHQESSMHLHRTIQKIKNLGIRAGIAVNPATPISTLTDIIEYVDMVLIMSVNPGFGGQSIITGVKSKFEDLKELMYKKNITKDIEIDGGITLNNLNDVLSWGANVIVAGSAIYGSENVMERTKQFMNILNGTKEA